MFKNRKNLASINSLGGKIQLSVWKKSRSRPEVFSQKRFLKISQNSQESNWTGVFFIRVTDLSLFCKTKVNGCFIKPRLLLDSIEQFPEFQSDDVFSCEFFQNSKNNFSYRAPPVAASVLWRWNVFFMRSLSSFLNFMKT